MFTGVPSPFPPLVSPRFLFFMNFSPTLYYLLYFKANETGAMWRYNCQSRTEHKWKDKIEMQNMQVNYSPKSLNRAMSRISTPLSSQNVLDCAQRTIKCSHIGYSWICILSLLATLIHQHNDSLLCKSIPEIVQRRKGDSREVLVMHLNVNSIRRMINKER